MCIIVYGYAYIFSRGKKLNDVYNVMIWYIQTTDQILGPSSSISKWIIILYWFSYVFYKCWKRYMTTFDNTIWLEYETIKYEKSWSFSPFFNVTSFLLFFFCNTVFAKRRTSFFILEYYYFFSHFSYSVAAASIQSNIIFICISKTKFRPIQRSEVQRRIHLSRLVLLLFYVWSSPSREIIQKWSSSLAHQKL